MTATLDTVGASIRGALLADTEIAGMLGGYEGEPSIHTKDAPEEAEYPMIQIPPATAVSDQDGLAVSRPVLVRDVLIYGRKPDDFRAVDKLGYMVRAKFHRPRFSIALEDHRVVQITATGPSPAPVNDDKTIGRVVSLTILVQRS